MSIEEAMNKIFDILKSKGKLTFDGLKVELGATHRIDSKARVKMHDLEAIEYDGSFYRLSDSANKHKNWDSYLKSLKKSNLTQYQKIYLAFFILFGGFGVYKVLKPSVSPSQLYPLNSRIEFLESQYDYLKTEYEYLKENLDSIKKKMSKPILKLLNDTSKTKKIDSLKIQ